jgi:hypothetical protein
MILLESVPDDRSRVTAGLPGLSPGKRRTITEFHLKLAYQRALQTEYRNNETSCTSADGSIDVTDYEQVVGIPLLGARIIGRLKKLNRNLWFEPAKADSSKTGVYILRNDFKGGQEKVFICGMETELNPEFSLRVTDDQGKPKGIISGWRRVLTKLIRAKLIDESAAFHLFGPPSRESENWARFVA